MLSFLYIAIVIYSQQKQKNDIVASLVLFNDEKEVILKAN